MDEDQMGCMSRVTLIEEVEGSRLMLCLIARASEKDSNFKLIKSGALWRRVIVELHGVNGGFDQTTRQGRNSGTWANIVRSCFDLEQMGVDLDKVMERKVTSQGRFRILDSKVICRYSNKWYQELGFDGSLDSRSTGVRSSSAIKFWAAMRVLGFEGLSKLVVRHKAFFEVNSQKVTRKDKGFARTTRISCWRSYLQPQLWHKITSFEKRFQSIDLCWVWSYGRLPRRRLQRGLKKGDLSAIDTAITDEDQAFLLLKSLPSSYDNLVETLLYDCDTLKLENRDMEQGIYSAWSKSQGRSSRLGCYICQSEEHLKRDCPRYNHKKSQGCVRIEDHVSGFGANGYDTVDGNIVRGMPCKGSSTMREWSSSCWTRLGTRRANYIYTLDGQAVTRNTLKGRKQLVEYQIGSVQVLWAEATTHNLHTSEQGHHHQRLNLRRL
ncbi:zinc finger, CCHC-type containing protein [Tanacetum coccineum]